MAPGQGGQWAALPLPQQLFFATISHEGKRNGRHLWKHESSFAQKYWHPHPRFSPDDSYILLTSSRDGDGNVYLIKLAETKM
ncbi:MAG: hypothetical protein IPP19_15300 [Verrucomicrobia bacterium]|nr:hypothetical protein [Verrucomicrobiota bacterium]